MKQFFLSILSVLLLSIPNPANAQWSIVGAAGFSDGVTSFNVIAIDGMNTPYVAYVDWAHSDKTTVKKFNGNSWITVGTQGFSADRVKNVCLDFDSNNTPYVAYSDLFYNYKLVVKKFDGNNWIDVGVPGFTPDRADDVSFTIGDNDTLYIAFKDVGNGNKLSVMKYNGSSWVFVGSAGISSGEARATDIAIDKNGVPYVAFMDFAISQKTIVVKYSGGSWVNVGTPGLIQTGTVYQTTLALDKNNTPYLSYNNQLSSVIKYDGSNWVFVGTTGFVSGPTQQPSLAIGKNGVIYLAFSHFSISDQVTVMKYNGSYWASVGVAGFSAAKGDYISLALDGDDVPYVSFRDYFFGLNAKATVMKYDCPYPQPKGQICAVTTDTLTGKNVVLWNNAPIPHVDSYRIYREDNGTYQYLGGISATAISTYFDLPSNPQLTSYTYKLTVVDSCDREMPIDSSVAHTTIRLAFDRLDNDTAEISWNSYIGKVIDSIVIKRSNNTGPFIRIGMAGPMDISYRDKAIPSGSNRYRIEAHYSGGCDIGGGTVYDRIFSNEVTAWNTGVSILSHNSIQLSPNPADNLVMIQGAEKIKQIMVYDAMGRLIKKENSFEKTGNSIRLDISDLNKGIYLLNASLHDGSYENIKFQKN